AERRRSNPGASTSQRDLGDRNVSQVRGVGSVEGKELTCAVSEGQLLEELMRQRGKLLDKQELAQLALGRKLTLYDRSLDMHVSNLRKKIGPHADGRPRIVALRSRGYYYAL
ncbi:DNA-binding response regulator, partial [Pseudomonas syringae]|uniref:winged helix-turn-helix domain-containing protein n=1 Tax=Pseudomonas syringae TaxID=317 RepID=UPI001F1B30CA